VGIFSAFEGKVDDAFDGMAGAVFKSPIEPTQIAKRCEKQMHRNKLVGKGVQYAPTLYTVLVNVDDDRRLFGFYPTMAGELETYLVGASDDAGLSLECRPLVRFIADEGLKSGKFDVVAEVVTSNIISELREEEAEYYGLDVFQKGPARQSGSGRGGRRPRGTKPKSGEKRGGRQSHVQVMPVQPIDNGQDFRDDDVATEPVADERYEEREDDGYRGGHANYGFQPAVLVDARSGDEYPIDYDSVIIGRDDTSDIALPDASVSRAHARISRDELGKWSITDLNSTNGTSVNGRKISNARLSYGDQVTVGTTILLFQKG
jgi:hypothetical protein